MPLTNEKMKNLMKRHDDLRRDDLEKGAFTVIKVKDIDMPWLFTFYDQTKILDFGLVSDNFVIEYNDFFDYSRTYWFVEKLSPDSFQIDGFYKTTLSKQLLRFVVICKYDYSNNSYQKVMFTDEKDPKYATEAAEIAFSYVCSFLNYYKEYAEECLISKRKIKSNVAKKTKTANVKAKKSSNLRTIITVRRPKGLKQKSVYFFNKKYFVKDSCKRFASAKQAAHFFGPTIEFSFNDIDWISKFKASIDNATAKMSTPGEGFYAVKNDMNTNLKCIHIVEENLTSDELVQIIIHRIDEGIFQLDVYDETSVDPKIILMVAIQDWKEAFFTIVYLCEEYGYLSEAAYNKAESLFNLFKAVLIYNRPFDWTNYKKGQVIRLSPIYSVFGKPVLLDYETEAI